MSAHRTATESQSFTRALSSPPTYWIGLLTSGRSGSRRANRDWAGTPAKSTCGRASRARLAAVVEPAVEQRVQVPSRHPRRIRGELADARGAVAMGIQPTAHDAEERASV